MILPQQVTEGLLIKKAQSDVPYYRTRAGTARFFKNL